MPFQFYKSKSLNLLPSGTIPPQAFYIKSNITNVADGGELIRCGYNANYAGRLIQFTSGSITSNPLATSNVKLFVKSLTLFSTSWLSS